MAKVREVGSGRNGMGRRCNSLDNLAGLGAKLWRGVFGVRRVESSRFN